MTLTLTPTVYTPTLLVRQPPSARSRSVPRAHHKPQSFPHSRCRSWDSLPFRNPPDPPGPAATPPHHTPLPPLPYLGMERPHQRLDAGPRVPVGRLGGVCRCPLPPAAQRSLPHPTPHSIRKAPRPWDMGESGHISGGVCQGVGRARPGSGAHRLRIVFTRGRGCARR